MNPNRTRQPIEAEPKFVLTMGVATCRIGLSSANDVSTGVCRAALDICHLT